MLLMFLVLKKAYDLKLKQVVGYTITHHTTRFAEAKAAEKTALNNFCIVFGVLR